MPESTGGTGFAERLRELKERSGHSYGMLAKRLHMSTSTLHRYCNGDAVPTDYAPVERMARLCGASAEELVALHRSWVLADAGRGRRLASGEAANGASGGGSPGGRGAAAGAAATGGVMAEEASAGGAEAGEAGAGGAEDEEGRPGRPEGTAAASRPAPVTAASPGGRGAAAGGAVAEEAGAGGVEDEEGRPGYREGAAPAPVTAVRRSPRRPVLVAAVATAAVLGAVALAIGLPGGGDRHRDTASAGATASAPGRSAAAGAAPRTRDSRSPSPSGSARHPSASATPGNAEGPDAAASGPPDASGAAPVTGVPLTVTTHPYSWESPCSQHYLIDRPPTEVSPPPIENDAPAWVAVHQAVSAGEQFVTLTVQGSGKDTVVLEGMSVRMAGKRAPLAWNDYAMGYPGVGCGGGVPTHSFTVALDALRPAVQPVAGQRGFPFSVSESDPEVFYVTADASAYDVSWYLELSWSSGGRHGTVRIGDKGRPFRTSGDNGRPSYAFPLGGEKWAPAQG
ncbi:hypothetical protein Shyhy01_61460 [Streptomyces hygroscopicus subsp. hygroscopicus]|uniref:helix-turn-helix domain-containing protein n=1 Tax=Streptomyces sp. KHY 26 TaxID=3097359 RepID=UPI0024A2906B|nr:helix-turn-helix transcriptional regulator [Streptomyces hygroscopicus]GLX53196.1 hypothetical protein Shyhy01_61460 [Streptomyces hygroscopicus subsp. hygroscopicus]